MGTKKLYVSQRRQDIDPGRRDVELEAVDSYDSMADENSIKPAINETF